MMQVQYIIWLSCCFKRMNKDREFTESKTIKQNTKMKMEFQLHIIKMVDLMKVEN